MQKKRQNICNIKDYPYLCTAFKKCNNMVTVVQLVRASDCGSECRGFESRTHRNNILKPLKVNHFQGLFSWGLNRETNPMTPRDAF